MAITEYYVSAAGGGSHDGSSEANALTFSEMVTQINGLGAGGGAGRRYNIKGAHTGRGATDTISVGGSATAPLILRGYNSTIGDLDTGTRDAYGVLDTTNFPDLGYSSGFGLTFSAGYVVVMNLDIAPNRNTNGVSATLLFRIINCRVVNSNTGSSTVGLYAELASEIVNCDISSGASSGTAAMTIDETCHVVGCRVTSPGAIGIRMTGTAHTTIAGCTIYGCGGDGIGGTSAAGNKCFSNNTIYSCVDGIDIASGSTGALAIVGNHITDCSGYGINFNGGTSGTAIVSGNRFRDNASGNTSGYADYVSGTSARNITTDAGGASTDYVDAATNKDFRLITTAAGYRQGFAYNANIGACGDNASSSGGVKVHPGVQGNING